MTFGNQPAASARQGSAEASADVGAGDREEIRLAVAFTGGVSLAVWMGGLAHEMNLLCGASAHRAAACLPPSKASGLSAQVTAGYRALLDLLRLNVSIDVLSGTSAGGINAALLGLARAQDLDLGRLRQLWLASGDLGGLLNVPERTAAPRSLLRGDDGLLTGLREGLTTIAEDRFQPPLQAPENLKVFITATLLEGQRRGFRDDFGTAVDDADHHGLFTFTREQLHNGCGSELARAARGSASFPAAFEPAFIRVGAGPADVPDMADYTSLSRSCWVADGGLLANRPLGPALEAVFDRSAAHDVRRVLAYVVPSASMPQEALPADASQPQSLGRAMLADLAAATSQTIADELRAIDRHNDEVAGVAQLRDVLLRAGPPVLQPGQLEQYRRHVARVITGPVVREIARRTETDLRAGPRGRGLLETARWAEASLLEGAPPRLPLTLSEPAAPDELAAFGRESYDAGRAVALSLVRDALAVPQDAERRRDLLALRESIGSLTRSRRADVSALRTVVAAALPGSGAIRGEVVDAVAGWVTEAHDPAALAQDWRALGALPFRVALEGVRLDERAKRLRDFLLAGDADVATRLFQLVVATRCAQPEGPEIEQRLELVQMSADTRTSLDPKRSLAADKLTGMQWHHFGAFYKQSWRASDWMWGRVDGVGWLVHLLLDPRRVLKLARHDPGWFAGTFRPGLAQLAATDVTAEAAQQLDRVEALARTDEGDLPPDLQNLGEVAVWVATGLQRLVAEEELPWVAEQARLDEEAGARRGVAAGFLSAFDEQSVAVDSAQPGQPRRALRQGASVERVFQSCLVSYEKLEGERGTRRYLETATQTLAVSVGLAAQMAAPVRMARPALLMLRNVALLAYWLRKAGTGPAITGAGLVVGGALVATSSISAVSGLGVVAIGAGFVLLSLFLGRRLPAVAVTIPLAAALLIGLAAFFPWSRDRLSSALSAAATYLPKHPVVWLVIVFFVLLPPFTTALELGGSRLHRRRADAVKADGRTPLRHPGRARRPRSVAPSGGGDRHRSE